MSADIQGVKAGERARVNHPSAGSASGGVDKRGRGHRLKNEADKTLFSGEGNFPPLGSDTRPLKLKERNNGVHAQVPKKVTANARSTANTGPTANIANTGPIVNTGPTANTGPTVNTGPTANSRPTANSGAVANSGPTANTGPTTNSGAVANSGPTANTGPTTNTGPTANSGPTANTGPTGNSRPTVNPGPTANSGPNRNHGNHGDNKGQETPKPKPESGLTFVGQDDSQGADENRGLKTNADPNTRSSDGKQYDPRCFSGPQYPNEREQTGGYRNQNKQANFKDPQNTGERGTRGRGAGPDNYNRPRRTSSGTIPEGGGVFLGPPPQNTGYNAFRDETGAWSRKPNQRRQKVQPPNPRPNKSQGPPDPPLDTKNAEVETKNAELETKNAELEAAICEMDEQIIGLKETISRLHRRDGDPTKADSHFTTGFSSIACAIEQWVLQHCPNGPADPDIGPQSAELQELLCMVSCEPEKNVGSHRMRVVSAVVAQLLLRRVFSSSFPGAPETAQELEAVVSKLKLQGTFYQCQRWRALTMSVLAKGDDFEGGLSMYVECITEDIGTILSILSPPEPNNPRRGNGLRDIVDQAAKLAVEVHKQPDLIFLNQVVPSSPYSAEYMEDTSCMYADSELEGGAATVKIQIFPTVLRRSYDSDESLPAVVMRAKVLAELPSPGEIPAE